MAQVRLFDFRRKNLPSIRHSGEPSEVLDTVLLDLTDLVKQAGQARIVCDLSNNLLTLAHVQYFADWLAEPGRNIHLHALDLCFNRILIPDCKSFLPLVEQLSAFVDFMEFGGNYLPAIMESDDELHKPVFDKVSLAPPHPCLLGNKWTDKWAAKARNFRSEAYGLSADL